MYCIGIDIGGMSIKAGVVDKDGKYIKEPMRPGEKIRVSYGHGAVKSEGYLLYYDFSGKLIEKKLIRKDTYSSSRGIIAVMPEIETA